MNLSALAAFRSALGRVGKDGGESGRFGIERRTLSGEWWQDHLTYDGAGRVTLSTLRSFGEVSGEEIGRYEGVIGTQKLQSVVRAIETCLPEGPRIHLEPSDLRVVLDVVAGGERFLRVAGGGPPLMEPYLDLMSELDQLSRAVREHPRATLAIGFELLAPPRRGTQEARVRVEFRNRGTEGYWMRNPASELEDEDGEHLRLLAAWMPPVEPGVTPLPPQPVGAALYASEGSDRPLTWIGPGETRALEFVTRLELEPGPHLMRVGFATYEGEDLAGGQPRLRGCAFSPERSFEIEE